MQNRRVAVTGMGAVTPVGNDAESTWSALVAGRSGIGRLDTFVADTYPVRIGGMVKDFDLAKHLQNDHGWLRHLSRAARFGVGAMLEAVADAGLEADMYAPDERGVSIGATMGRPELEEVAEVFVVHEGTGGKALVRQAPSAVMLRDQNVGAAVIAALADCQGPMISVSTACAGSAHAIGEAFRRIQDGEVRLMITGGQDALTSWVDVLGFSLLGALATGSEEHPDRACRPFDRERSGFVLGEGAVMMVLEDWESAKARGANIRAEILGYGSSLNAYRITDAPPDGGGAILAITSALKESGLRNDEVDYVA